MFKVREIAERSKQFHVWTLIVKSF